MMVTHGAPGREGKMVKGVLIDLTGRLCRNQALPGSLDAIRESRVAHSCKFVTNTTPSPAPDCERCRPARSRHRCAGPFHAGSLARDFLARRNLVPLLIVHPDLREDFAGLARMARGRRHRRCGAFFTYDLLNQAYRKILHGAEFLALAKNRNFLDHDNELSLDAGPFVAGSNTLR